jgi:hypothetical protein
MWSATEARRRQAGSALTEFLICLFPYAMILTGVIVLGQLGLGTQEAQKAAILAGPLPEEQSEEAIREYAFGAMEETDSRHEFGFRETVNPELSQSYENEEPVLPYTGRDDVHAGFVRIENPRAVARVDVNDEGEVVVETEIRRSAVGSYLQGFRIMSTDRGSTDGHEDDIRRLLGDWLTYSRATATYAYAFGGGALPQEGESEDDLRGRFAIRGLTGEEGIVYYGTARTGQDHGSHQPHRDDVSLDELSDLTDRDEIGGTIDPAAMPAPPLDSLGGGAQEFFDIKHRFPDASP